MNEQADGFVSGKTNWRTCVFLRPVYPKHMDMELPHVIIVGRCLNLKQLAQLSQFVTLSGGIPTLC